MAYPTGDQYTPQVGSTITADTNYTAQISQSGVMRVVKLGGVTYHYIKMVVGRLNESDRDTLLGWIDSNMGISVTDLPFGSDTYTGLILPDPVRVSNWRGAPALFSVEFRFRGTKN